MRRNKESFSRQKIICTHHLNRDEQQCLDEYVRNSKMSYSEVLGWIEAGAIFSFIAGAAFRRVNKKLAESYASATDSFVSAFGKGLDMLKALTSITEEINIER